MQVTIRQLAPDRIMTKIDDGKGDFLAPLKMLLCPWVMARVDVKMAPLFKATPENVLDGTSLSFSV